MSETLTKIEQLARIGRPEGETARRELVSSSLLAALSAAGTRHVYGDTGDVDELGEVILVDGGERQLAEVDGDTVNQPLLAKVLPGLLSDGDPARRAREVLEQEGLSEHRAAIVYAVLCARVGTRMTREFAAGRSWEVSLQLHMDVVRHRAEAVRVGRFLHELVPNALVKVPFLPDEPGSLLVARDLERAGVAVNLTSTFSARQVAVAALLCGATRTNVFMGRIEQGLGAERLGEHVCLEAQRCLRELRRLDGVATQLIVASMREWHSFVRLAGCDVFTAPCDVLRGYLEQDEVAPEEVTSRLDDELRPSVSPRALEALGAKGVARLHEVEPELLEFLRSLRRRPEDPAFADGHALRQRFDSAGFGDLFHDPTAEERAELREGKLPDLDGRLVGRVALDTHYSLLANADFEKHQEAIDGEVAARSG